MARPPAEPRQEKRLWAGRAGNSRACLSSAPLSCLPWPAGHSGGLAGRGGGTRVALQSQGVGFTAGCHPRPWPPHPRTPPSPLEPAHPRRFGIWWRVHGILFGTVRGLSVDPAVPCVGDAQGRPWAMQLIEPVGNGAPRRSAGSRFCKAQAACHPWATLLLSS